MTLKVTSANITSTPQTVYCQPFYTKGTGILDLATPSSLVLDYTTELTINFESLDFSWQPNSDYTIEIPEGFVVDKESPGLGSPAQTISFTTGPGPATSEIIPIANTTGYNSPLVTLKFNHIVKAGSGNIKLYNFSTSTLVSTISITNSRVSFRTGNCVINLRGLISNNTTYYITIDSGAIQNKDHVIFSGVSGNSTIKFQTGNDNILSAVSQDLTYNRGGTFNLTDSPTITDTYSSSLDYSLSIQSSDNTVILSMSNSVGPYYLNESVSYSTSATRNMAFSSNNRYFAHSNGGNNPISLIDLPSGVTTSIYPSGTGSASFGSSIALSYTGSIIAVTGQDLSNNFLIAIFRNGSVESTFTYTTSQTGGLNAKYISQDGNTLIVQKSHNGSNTTNPEVLVYKYNGSSWSLEATIAPSELTGSDTFGYSRNSLSSDGNLLVFSSPSNGSNKGIVYFYRRSGSTWTQEKKIIGTTGQQLGYYMWANSSGTKVYISKNTTSTDVYSYSSSTWTLTETITGSARILAENDDENIRVDSDFNIFTKVNNVWHQGKSYISTHTIGSPVGPSIAITPDLSLLSVNNSPATSMSIFSPEKYGTSYNSTNKTLTITLPSAILNDVISSGEIQVTMASDNPLKHDQAYIEDFEIIYTLTTPDSRTDYKTQVIKFY